MDRVKKSLLDNQSVIVSILALVMALIVISLILIATNRNPLDAFYYFSVGAFGTVSNTANTISRVIPLSIAGCAFLIGAKTGAFNVGIEGQLLLGALASAVVGYAVKLPAVLHLPLMLIAGMVAGGLWGFVPGWLKTYRGVNEILSTIMLNYPALYFCHFMTIKVLKADGVVPATPMIEATAKLPTLIAGTRLHSGIFIALLVVFLTYMFFKHTVLGYEMRAVGINRDAARYHGIPVEKRMLQSFVLGGILAGLAGAVEIAGVHYRFLDQFSPGYGYDSITVALLGLLSPIGVLFSATLFGALKTGSLEMAVFTDIPRQLVTLIQGVVILFIAAQNLLRQGVVSIATDRPKISPEDEKVLTEPKLETEEKAK